MTTEIAILNKTAVALAADSKVTVRSEDDEKTYDTVNKLFTLSRIHPVGVMVYGNADFMEFPWETIIKMYRKQKGTRCESTIANWGKDLIAYLGQFFEYTQTDCESNIVTIARAHLGDLVDRARVEVLEADGRLTFDDAISAELDDMIEISRSSEEFMSADQEKAFLKQHTKTLRKEAARLPVGSKEIKDKFYDFLTTSLPRHHYSPVLSGIVVAGFGEDERLPALVSYDVDGFVAPGLLKHQETNQANVTRKNNAIIIPFAQGDMVVRFMEGIDGTYREFLQGSLKQIMIDNAVDIVDSLAENVDDIEAVKATVKEIAAKQFEEFDSLSLAYRLENYVAPIIGTVGTLPKEELANMADALVNLTSLKRRVSFDRETVGGPVDVAVISKGDGFIWIKRKHYFDPKFNHHFSENYFRDIKSQEKKDE